MVQPQEAGSFSVSRRAVGRPRELSDRPARALRSRQMGHLMRVALLLKKRGILAILAGLVPFAVQVHEIKRRRMGTAHEPRQIAGRKEKGAAEFPHSELEPNPP